MPKNKTKLPKSLTTVTTFSKLLAIILFITFPLFTFNLGLNFNPGSELVKMLTNYKSAAEITAVSSHVTYDCQISIELSNGQTIFVNTEYYDLDTPSADKCYQFVENEPSPSGKFVAYRDISGGLDSKVSLFSVADYQVYTIGNWGTSDLINIDWADDDRLIVLYGWRLEPESHHISLYDLSNWDSLEFNEYNFLKGQPVDLEIPKSAEGYYLEKVESGKVILKSGEESVEIDLP